MMKQFIFFPLWEMESLEKVLEEMEKSGNRLTNVNCSYWFTFKKSNPGEMRYFLSYKSFRGQGMGWCGYALESEHRANIIDGKGCYYSLYRTNEEKENLSALYEVRMDYIKRILLEKALTALVISVIFLLIFLGAVNTNAGIKSVFLILIFVLVSVCFAIYYLYGYFKQRNKCRMYEQNT